MFGKNMILGRDGQHPGLPLWFLEDAYRNWSAGETLFDHVVSAAKEVGEDATLILTSENLAQPGMSRLFSGIDRVLETHVIFYMRPQTDWIPSAWKQWAVKKGVSLGTFINDCLKRSHPANERNIGDWASTLPHAKITVRPFFPDVMKAGNPAADFFDLLGFDGYDTSRLHEQANPSIDYSLMHVLMLNAKDIFEGIHDNRFSDKIEKMLPERYKRANAAMLSTEVAEMIEQHFREENLRILSRYCGLSEGFYQDHYAVKPRTASYMEKADAEIFERAFGILAEANGGEWAARVIAAALADMATDFRSS